MIDLTDLQHDVRQWHAKKYPDARLEAVGLKLGEEAGEVMRAIDRYSYADTVAEAAHWRRNFEEEVGDVCVVLMVLCSRFSTDFEDAILKRAAEVMAR